MVDFRRWWRKPGPAIDIYSIADLTQRLRHRYRLAAVLSRIHRFLYVFLKGRFVSNRGSARFLLLTTKGRRSQRKRTVVLLYVSRYENPAVIASVGGNPKAPGWLLNIRDNPKVKVQIGGVKWDGNARIATDEERQELWPQFVRCYSGYERYQAKTTRRFPIVIITLEQD